MIKIIKKQLVNLYLNKKLSTVIIAKIYNCYASTIRDKLIKFEIPIRDYKEGISLRKQYGESNPNYGKGLFGENNPAYKDGRYPINESIRGLENYKNWRKEVYTRDNFECIKCGENKGNNLQAHHTKAFAILLSEFLKEYDQFSSLEDKETLIRLATKYKPFWNVDNGQTLCEDCHRAIKKYTMYEIKKNKESD